MFELIGEILTETAKVLYQGSLYILLGFLIAGLLHELMPTRFIARHLGAEKPRSVFLAALFGAPIPLCSCGVLPTAAALRKKGASKSSLTSFLISTPETGVDSVALTYGLLGPVMAVVRPLVAIVTAMVAGLVSLFLPEERDGTAKRVANDALEELHHQHPHEHPDGYHHEDDVEREGVAEAVPWRTRTRRMFHYGFGTLLDEIAFWLVIGILLTGVLSALIPDGFFVDTLGWDSGLLPMLAMIVAGVPLYLCASASTPVAAALVAKGLSPGAALVFLLVGPATNAATLAVVGRLLGARRLRIYLGSIVLVSLAAGMLLDVFAADSVRMSALGGMAGNEHPLVALTKAAAAFGFVVLLGASFVRTRFHEGRDELRDQLRRLQEAMTNLTWQQLTRGPVMLSGAALALLVVVPNMVLLVGPGERGIVQRFGRVVAGNLEPGMHWHWPSPVGAGQSVDVDRVRRVTVGFGDGRDTRRIIAGSDAYYLTADENIIDLRSEVFYRVNDATRFQLGVEGDTDQLIRNLAQRELVATTSGISIDTLYTTARRETEQAYRDALTQRLQALGIGCEIVDVRFVHVHAPANVHDAFRDVASALEDRQTEVHVASGYAAETTAGAQGESASVVQSAHAEAKRAEAMAEGDTSGFTALADVHDRHRGVTETRLYLETLENSIAASRKYLHGSESAGGEIDLWIGAEGETPVERLNPQSKQAKPGNGSNPQ